MLCSAPTLTAGAGAAALVLVLVLAAAGAGDAGAATAGAGAATAAGWLGANEIRSTPAASAALESERMSAGSAGLLGSWTPSLASAACTFGRLAFCACRL